MKKKNVLPTEDKLNLITLCLTVFGVFFAIWTFTGKWPWIYQPYNSYILQAQSWLDGRLDLAENYSHLEIAIFNGKYFISFPPFPSYIMLPFVALGFDKCDGMIALISALAGVVYAYKILSHYGIDSKRSLLFSLLLTIGSNWLFTAQIAWVWFIAQNMAFTLSLMAIYYALKGKGGLSLAFWACAVGCRPMQAIYLPVLLYLLYNSYKSSDNSLNLPGMIKSKWKCIIPMAIIALSYMTLNYARFGNPLEFGHNYLPEHTNSQYGQFHWIYIIDNLKTLFRLPTISYKEAWEYQAFNGTNIFIVSPIFISYVIYTAYSLMKNQGNRRLILLIFAMMVLEILALTAHVTMGGSQFGHRYINDILPLAFLSIAVTLPKDTKYDRLNIILLIFGLTVNTIGSVLYYL